MFRVTSRARPDVIYLTIYPIYNSHTHTHTFRDSLICVHKVGNIQCLMHVCSRIWNSAPSVLFEYTRWDHDSTTTATSLMNLPIEWPCSLVVVQLGWRPINQWRRGRSSNSIRSDSFELNTRLQVAICLFCLSFCIAAQVCVIQCAFQFNMFQCVCVGRQHLSLPWIYRMMDGTPH